VKREKEVECKVKLSYHEQDIQKIGDINYLTRLNIVFFPKKINVSYQIQLMPYPCSHFYFDINFGNRLYSKEKRPGSPLLF
jgi:hypothetical protein